MKNGRYKFMSVIYFIAALTALSLPFLVSGINLFVCASVGFCAGCTTSNGIDLWNKKKVDGSKH